ACGVHSRNSLPLFEPNVLGEIILGGVVAFEDRRNSLWVPTAGETLFQERHHKAPGILGRLPPVASRHGIVEPAVRRVAVEPHMITLLRPFQTTAEADDIVHRDNMIRLSEDPQYGARYLCDKFLDGARPKRIAIPFFPTDGPVQYHSSRDII